MSMFKLFRYQKNGLPYGLITVHEVLVNDIFSYFETGRFVKKQIRKARRSLKGALRFTKKKKTYPSNKTTELLDALAYIDDELAYTQTAIRTAFKEADDIITMIRQEKTGDIIPLVEKARERFQNRDLEGGMEMLREAQLKLSNPYLPHSRKTLLGGLESEVRQLKRELMERKNGRIRSSGSPTNGRIK
jgi:hypothetical protein